jgi:integrase
MTKRKRIPGVEALSGGEYRIRVRVTDPRTGRRIEKDRKVQCAGLTEAERMRMQLTEELEKELEATDLEALAQAPRSKLGDLARAWVEKKVAAKRADGTGRLTPNTQRRYVNNVETMIVPFLGERTLDRLTKGHVEEWRDHLGGFYASATVNGALRTLKTMLGDLGSSAAERVETLREDDTRITDDEPNALTEKQLDRFLEAARDETADHYAMILVLLTTAARISTVRALRWSDLKPEEGEIHFRQRVSGTEVLPGVKRSRTSKDVAPLLPEVLEALKVHRADFNPKQQASELVFPSLSGGFRARSVLDKPFARIRAKAGIDERFTPHGCRRTAAALYRRAAGSVVSKSIAGHTTDEMHRHYAIVSSAEKQQAARLAFAGLQSPEKGGTPGGIEAGTAKKGGSKRSRRVASTENSSEEGMGTAGLEPATSTV